MSEYSQIFEKLRESFPEEEIEWRPGAFTESRGGMALALAYITARSVMNRLDEVVGSENWQTKFFFGPNGEVVCELSLRIGGEWITKSDGAERTEVEAAKGGISDALKRSAVQWGIGRYLYGLTSIWVPAEKRQGKTVVFKERPELPEWAKIPQERKSKQTKTPEQQANKQQENNQQTDKKLENTARAKSYIVPNDLPEAGKKLGDETISKELLGFFAGILPNAVGQQYAPKTKDDKAFQAAAKFLYEQ